MKKILPVLALTLLLTACGTKTAKFAVTFDTTDPKRTADLTAAVQRMVEGRLLAKKKTVVTQEITKEDGRTVLTVDVSDAEGAAMLQESLAMPFTMSIMKQVDAGQGDIINEKFGEFKETGIETKHFDWVVAGTTGTGLGEKGAVMIEFTPEGQALLKDMFSKNRGAWIGIFTHGQLMSKKLIDASDKQTSIAIDGIPSGTVAAAFGDDVNVGLHTTFTPLP